MSKTGFLTWGSNPDRPDFSAMTEEELRAYILAHRQDQEAFHIYMDRMQQRPPVAVIEPSEWSEERMQQILDEIQ